MTIVKYNNRKLYNPETSAYVTLTDLLKLPLGSFTVVKHGTNKDITTDTLLLALTTGNTKTEMKVRVMQHVLNELAQVMQ